MFHLVVALAFTPAVLAQQQYTVWSSVIFQRTGDRTPEVIGNGTEATVLTSLGQQQAYNAGSFFRNRYIAAAYGHANGTNGDEVSGGPMPRLAPDNVDSLQTYAIALDQQYNIASAYAWFQGMYPPSTLDSSANYGDAYNPANEVVQDNGTATGVEYLSGPLNGYQYPAVHVASGYDPNFVYLGAHLDCPAYAAAAASYTLTPEFTVTREEFQGIYDAIGSAVFEGVLDEGAWDYYNAYAIYDWLNYQNTHNQTIAETLARYKNVTTGVSYLDTLRWLSDEQQQAQLGNLTAVNPYNGQNSLPNTMTGSISTIAGNMLAAKVLGLLQEAIQYNAAGEFQLNVLFSDYAPLMSFFALMGLSEYDTELAGLPEFGSSAAFELFSYADAQNPTFPDISDLNVRFMFRNGTNESEPYLSYPLFNRGPSQTDMSWDDFSNTMNGYVMGDVAEWCTACGAENLFCYAFNSTSTSGQIWLNGNIYTNSHGLKPVVAGVIGAIVTLAVAALLFVAMMLLFGLRFHRNNGRRQSELGGFKGGQKMASDQDLTIPKGGAIVGASVERSPTSPTGGHERVGSWELKQAEAGRNLAAGGRPSMEQARRTPDITEGAKPVRPLERV